MDAGDAVDEIRIQSGHTDGNRVLVFTHSGKEHLNEAYRFHVERLGDDRKVGFRRTLEVR